MNYIQKKDILLPKRKKSSRKGQNGNVLILGGSIEYVGAVALAGIAALRCGADSVHVAAPEKVAWAVNCLSPDLVTTKLSGSYFSQNHSSKIAPLLKKADVVLLGNGIGQRSQTKQFVKKTISKIDIPLVLDADGIKLASTKELNNTILTPHIRELELFMKNSDVSRAIISQVINEKNTEMRAKRIKKALDFLGSKTKNQKPFFQRNNVIILKGPVDTIISEQEIIFNKTGNAGMTKAGTGDVLAGLTAGFVAQSSNLVQGSINATYFCGKTGDTLSKRKKGFTYLASDLAEALKHIRK